MLTIMITVVEGTATGTTCLEGNRRTRLLPIGQVSLPGYLAKNDQVNKNDSLWCVAEGRQA